MVGLFDPAARHLQVVHPPPLRAPYVGVAPQQPQPLCRVRPLLQPTFHTFRISRNYVRVLVCVLWAVGRVACEATPSPCTGAVDSMGHTIAILFRTTPLLKPWLPCALIVRTGLNWVVLCVLRTPWVAGTRPVP